MATNSQIKQAPLLRKIEQKDNYSFEIVWTDGLVTLHRLSDLQRECPCAFCFDEITGEKKIDSVRISDKLTAKRIQSVGRYAIKIDFMEGCSFGIYTYEFLRGRKN